MSKDKYPNFDGSVFSASADLSEYVSDGYYMSAMVWREGEEPWRERLPEGRQWANLVMRDGRLFRRIDLPIEEPPAELRRHGLEGMSWVGEPLVRTFRNVGVRDGLLCYEDVTDPAVVEAYERSRCQACRGGGMHVETRNDGNLTTHIHGTCPVCKGRGSAPQSSDEGGSTP